jgi:hypothetical protein
MDRGTHNMTDFSCSLKENRVGVVLRAFLKNGKFIKACNCSGR